MAFLLKHTLGPDWKKFFHLAIAGVQKPLWQWCESPYYLLDKKGIKDEQIEGNCLDTPDKIKKGMTIVEGNLVLLS